MQKKDKRIGKPCSGCENILNQENIIKSSGNLLCKPCFNAKQRDWSKRTPELQKARKKRYYEKNKADIISKADKWSKANNDKRKKINASWRWRLRLKMIEAYGGSCSCCGESEPKFLSVDHVNNDGYKRRQNGEGSGAALYRQLRDRGWPKEDYQLLCMNCNFAKGHFGVCPHKELDFGHLKEGWEL